MGPPQAEPLKDQWETPSQLFTLLDDEFCFDLDVCASADNTKCDRFFDRATNGLVQRWAPLTCWCNPPYSDVMPWIMKAIDEAIGGAVVVLLLPGDTSTKWWHLASQWASERRELIGRVRFVNAPGAPKFGSVLFVFNGRYQAGMGKCCVSSWDWRARAEEA
jgi:site-specific DNA-methyltransferase (adenine-specific)